MSTNSDILSNNSVERCSGQTWFFSKTSSVVSSANEVETVLIMLTLKKLYSMDLVASSGQNLHTDCGEKFQ